jgi:hypothetical protein
MLCSSCCLLARLATRRLAQAARCCTLGPPTCTRSILTRSSNSRTPPPTLLSRARARACALGRPPLGAAAPPRLLRLPRPAPAAAPACAQQLPPVPAPVRCAPTCARARPAARAASYRARAPLAWSRLLLRWLSRVSSARHQLACRARALARCRAELLASPCARLLCRRPLLAQRLLLGRCPGPACAGAPASAPDRDAERHQQAAACAD